MTQWCWWWHWWYGDDDVGDDAIYLLYGNYNGMIAAEDLIWMVLSISCPCLTTTLRTMEHIGDHEKWQYENPWTRARTNAAPPQLPGSRHRSRNRNATPPMEAAVDLEQLSGCGWCSPWSMCMQLLPEKKTNQFLIGRIGMCFKSPSCALPTCSDNVNLLTKTLWTSLSGFVLLQRAIFSNPPDLWAVCSPTSATKSRAAEMHDVQEASASNESSLGRAQFQSTIASLQVCSANYSLIILEMEPIQQSTVTSCKRAQQCFIFVQPLAKLLEKTNRVENTRYIHFLDSLHKVVRSHPNWFHQRLNWRSVL